MVPLPTWLRLWLQEKNEKKEHFLLLMFNLPEKNLVTTQDSPALQNSDEK